MINEMVYICDNEYDQFLNLPNVNGVGIGYKEIGNTNTGELCLKVLVTEKVSLESLNEEDIVPAFYKGFKTDVIEVGEIYAYTDTNYYRPAPGGCQIQPLGAGFVGTFGCLVSNKSGTDLTTYVLSNNHVMADSNNLPVGTTIVQPSGTAANTIATLSAFVPIDFSPGNQNLVDSAIAKVTSTTLVTNQILVGPNTLGPSPKGIASAQLGGAVHKYGRTTNFTTGTIVSINTTTSVNYGASGNATFIKQIATTDMSDPGDSGSSVLDSSYRVVGLLFAGSSTTTIMNDIREVLRSYRARLV